MTRLSPSFVATWVAAALCGPAALAQTAPAPGKAQAPSIVIPSSPAPKTGSAKTLGGKGAPAGKVMTREELRTCLKRLDTLNASVKDLSQRRTAMDQEKDELGKSGEALKALRADVDTRLAAVRAWEVRMRAYAAEVESFNRRSQAVDQAPKAEREELNKALDAERERLNQARIALGDEEARLVPAYENSVRSYNERALARDGAVSDWNARNGALNETGLRLEEDRLGWVTECANRPYREDDEIAIKAGK